MTDAKNQVLQNMIRLLDENREAILAANAMDLDAYRGGEQAMYDRLIVPRGGEQLIRFVKQESSVPVLVSGRGNNFL